MNKLQKKTINNTQKEYTALLGSITTFLKFVSLLKRQSVYQAHHVDISTRNRCVPSAQILQQSLFPSEYHQLCYEGLFMLRSEHYNGRIGVILSQFHHIYKHDSCF